MCAVKREAALSRAEMLAEMGISPQWQLRGPAMPPTASCAVSGPVTASPALETRGAQTRPDVDEAAWDALVASVRACRACALCEHRHQPVLGVGDRSPTWLFIGEAPGAEEDVKGEPFVGQAGRLLDNMLAAIGLNRGEGVYIANAVKCRPPGNRTPESKEIAACHSFLMRQIELLQPRIVVLLGRAAVHAVLGEDVSLASMRQQMFAFGKTPVVVTYHPAYLLRNLTEKYKVWEDLLFARACLKSRSNTSL